MPDIVGVTGTGTEVGKTWVTAALAAELHRRGCTVAARKPVQSFASHDRLESRDASVLAAATGELPTDVCPQHRSYEEPMAPPMAAAALGRPRFTLADLVTELTWPSVDIALVETVGGVRSPIADDGDCAQLLRALAPRLVIIVADAGLGTINLVRLSANALNGLPLLVMLNRYEAGQDLHRRNRAWLVERDGLDVAVTVEQVVEHVLRAMTSSSGDAVPKRCATN